MAKPASSGVTGHEAKPPLFVAPLQERSPSVKATLALGIAAAGMADTSVSEALSVAGWPKIPPVGLGLSVRKVVCGPVAHVTCARFDVTLRELTVAVATIASVPVMTPE